MSLLVAPNSIVLEIETRWEIEFITFKVLRLVLQFRAWNLLIDLILSDIQYKQQIKFSCIKATSQKIAK
jgi:hypothetical protein